MKKFKILDFVALCMFFYLLLFKIFLFNETLAKANLVFILFMNILAFSYVCICKIKKKHIDKMMILKYLWSVFESAFIFSKYLYGVSNWIEIIGMYCFLFLFSYMKKGKKGKYQSNNIGDG